MQDTIKTLFLENGTLRNHYKYQTENYYDYVSILFLLFKCDVDLTMLTKATVLAVALARNDRELGSRLLSMEQFGLPEIVKACKILDAGRCVKQLGRKVDKLVKQGARKFTVGKMETELKAVKKFSDDVGNDLGLSLSGAKAKFIRKNWVQRLSKEQLELDAMMLPVDYWKQLADFIHVKKTDFKLDWFLSFVFGGKAGEDSILENCRRLSNENSFEIITKYKPSYKYLRTLNKNQLVFAMTDALKAFIAGYTDLDTVLWYWEELTCKDVDFSIIERLAKGERLTLSYGKLMERLMMVKSKHAVKLFEALLTIAEAKLKDFSVNLEQPVVVLGDASASMEVAIKTSGIIMSLLCAICNAEMRLFRDVDDLIEMPPKTVRDVIMLSQTCKAERSTAPAASLWPYLNDKKVVKTFVLVTDEEENTACNNHNFATMFREYREKVYAAKLVFVSFTPNDNDGFMISALKKTIPGIEKDIMKFRMDSARPDLTKIDLMLGAMTSQSDKFRKDAVELSKKMELEKKLDVVKVEDDYIVI